MLASCAMILLTCTYRFVPLTGNTTDAVHDGVNLFLANGVVTTGIVVGGILGAVDEKLGVEELAVRAGAELVDGRGVEVDKQGTGNMLSVARLGEEGLEGAGIANILRVGVGSAVRAQAVLEKVAIWSRAVSRRVHHWRRSIVRTAPKQRHQAGHQPGPSEREESGSIMFVSKMEP